MNLFKVFMSEQVPTEVGKVLMSGMITQGEKVQEFEKKLQEWFNYPYILTLNSATSGLTLALRLLNLQPNDEVLTSALTCTATNWPILANNLNIKWVDVNRETCNICLTDLTSKITKTTKAILLIHWGGNPIDLLEIENIKEYTRRTFGFEIPVIEDCAHAFGSEYQGKKLGTHGFNTCVFSLQAIKHLTTGDGGLIFLKNKEDYERAKLLRWFGIDRTPTGKNDHRMENDIKEWGYKFHMNDINATIGLCNLEHVAKLLNITRENAEYYNEKLFPLSLSKKTPSSLSAYWLYTIRVPRKTEFISFMKKHNITVSQVHNRNDKHTCVEKFRTTLLNLDKLETEMVCIPVGWWITREEREKIVELIYSFLSENTQESLEIFLK